MSAADVLPPSQPPRVVLRTIGLHKRIGRRPILSGLDLVLREGTLFCLLGRQGCGKTTALQTLMGILSSGGGQIQFYGKHFRQIRAPQRQHIGYVPQEIRFYPFFTCRQMGAFVGRFYRNWEDPQFERLMSLFYLPPKRPISELDPAMRYKLALALALAHRPKLLIIDEPSAGLEPAAHREILEIVSRQAHVENRATLIAARRPGWLEHAADQVGFMDRGRLCCLGDPRTLKLEYRRFVFPHQAQDALGDRKFSESGGIDSSSIDGGYSYWRNRVVKAGFEIVTEQPPAMTLVARAGSATWDTWSESWAPVQAMSLEDIFLANAIDRRPFA